MSATMDRVDILVVALYFLLVLAVGLLAMRWTRRSTLSGYFLAGRSVSWPLVGASLFVSNVGSEHFVGLAGSGAASGLAVAAWEINSLLLLQLLGWVFVPVYLRAGVRTTPQYLARRYGGRRLRAYFSGLTLALYVFTKLSVALYAGALFIQESLGWNLYLSVILLISATALLTVTGGLAAVIYTDALQAVVMVGGALCLAVLSLARVGGLEGLRTHYMQATPDVAAILLASPNLTSSSSCPVEPKPQALRLLRRPLDPDLPWPGFLLGQTPASIWYWCADQVIVQRALAARSLAHAKGATLAAGLLKTLPMFLIVVPGMVARVLFPDQLACIGPEHCLQVCGSRAGCSNVAYPRLVMAVMPASLRGLMMAAVIAALMSDLDSIFNSASAIFTLDVYAAVRRRASSRELMVVGRVFVVVMVIISMAWVPVVVEMQGGQMFYYIQEVSDYLTPPVAALFLLGVLWRRCNERGAFWGGMVGLALGALRLVLAFVYREPLCDRPDERPSFVKDVHFMYVAMLLFWVSGTVTVVVSLCTPPPSAEQVRTTTYWGLRHGRAAPTGDVNQEEMGELSSGPHGVLSGQSSRGLRNGTKDAEAGLLNHTDNCSAPPATNPELQNGGHHDHATGSGTVVEEDGGEFSCCGGGGGGGGGERSAWRRALDWFCGVKGARVQPGLSQEEDTLVEEMLGEAPRTKLLLNAGLVLICSLGVFLLTYFSV